MAEARQLVGPLVALDIEDPAQEAAKEEDCVARCERHVLPIEDIFATPVFRYGLCCCFLPEAVKSLFPGTWRRIHGWTQLSLIFGIFACALLILDSAMMLAGRLPLPPKCWNTLCAQELLALLYVIPVAMYFMECMQQFDERVQEKQKAIRAQRQKLIGEFQSTINDLEGLLGKSAESSAGLAERNFESKRRDFQRFLQHVKSQNCKLTLASEAENHRLRDQFKQLVRNWLKVYQECSLDPVNNPQTIVTPEELDQTGSIPELADLVLQRLVSNEVRFVSAKRAKDKEAIEGHFSEAAQLAKGEAAPWYRRQGSPQTRWRLPAWLLLGPSSSAAAGAAEPPDADGYPREFGFGCGRVAVLSQEHGRLLFGFFIGWLIWLVEFRPWTDEQPNKWMILYILLIETCLAMLLVRFEEIDKVQQLQREFRQLKEHTERLDQKSKEMKASWQEVQLVTEIWLYRTVPRLDLHKEVHCLMEGELGGEDMLTHLACANSSLEHIEGRIGAIALWHGKGSLDMADKTGFSNAVNKLIQANDLEEIMEGMENLGVKSIADGAA